MLILIQPTGVSMIEKIPLDKFKQGKREVYTDFVNGLVKWKRKTYKISYVNVGGKKYPYVILEDIKPLSEIKEEIRAINFNKKELKLVEYDINGHVYFVIGIGPIAIKAYKDNSKKPKYFGYSTTEGQYILKKLMNVLQQSILF